MCAYYAHVFLHLLSILWIYPRKQYLNVSWCIVCMRIGFISPFTLISFDIHIIKFDANPKGSSNVHAVTSWNNEQSTKNNVSRISRLPFLFFDLQPPMPRFPMIQEKLIGNWQMYALVCTYTEVDQMWNQTIPKRRMKLNIEILQSSR